MAPPGETLSSISGEISRTANFVVDMLMLAGDAHFYLIEDFVFLKRRSPIMTATPNR